MVDVAMPFSRVLFIAPSDSKLRVAPEIDALTELGFVTRSLEGEVTADRVFVAARNTYWDILHFACEADQSGVRLSNGELFDVDAILQVVRMAGAKLVFLNGCSTFTIGQILVDEHVSMVIAAMQDIKDDLAKQTSQAFYTHLARLRDPHAAYLEARPASRGMFQWLTNGDYQAMLLEPILCRLNDLAALIEADKSEHSDFRRGLRVIVFLRIAVALIVGLGLAQLLLLLGHLFQ